MEAIISRQNSKVKEIVALCDSARLRRESGRCVAHGVKLCLEAVRLGLRLKELWVTSSVWVRQEPEIVMLAEAADERYEMSDSVCEKISPERSPQGVAAVIAIPRQAEIELLAARKRLIALDGVQDPGNVGAVTRTAAALGYGGMLLSAGCADPFAPKTLRASMGAVFGVELAPCDLAPALEQIKKRGHAVVALTLEPSAENICEAAKLLKKHHAVLVIGSEGKGISPQVRAMCDGAVMIPMTDRAESLNAAVAAGIAMWAFSC